MALTTTETSNRDRILALYREVLDPHDRTRLRIFVQDDHVIVHLHCPVGCRGKLNEAGMIMEHWDVVQKVPQTSKNANPVL